MAQIPSIGSSIAGSGETTVGLQKSIHSLSSAARFIQRVACGDGAADGGIGRERRLRPG
jgi:hypothetical protein